MKKLKRILIMAGGTGGHVFPGLAVANYLRAQGVEVHWLGTEQGLEAKIVPQAGIPLHCIEVKGLRGKGLKALLSAPLKLTQALKQAKHILSTVEPDVVLGMGGFASGPGGLAAWLLKRPLVIHEQNAKAGLTNKILANLAKKVLAGFPQAFKKHKKVWVLGNPVRQEIESIQAPAQRILPHAKLRLLVLGGSLGAGALNELVPQAMALLPQDKRPEIFHQSGDKLWEAAKTAYHQAGIAVNLQPFVQDMAGAYQWADLVVCRAGALTVAELCAAGVGAILVPYPHAVDDHQTANAAFMVEGGAALCIQQRELTAAGLADIVNELIASPEKRLSMAESAYALRQVKVAERIAAICEEVCP